MPIQDNFPGWQYSHCEQVRVPPVFSWEVHIGQICLVFTHTVGVCLFLQLSKFDRRSEVTRLKSIVFKVFSPFFQDSDPLYLFSTLRIFSFLIGFYYST